MSFSFTTMLPALAALAGVLALVVLAGRAARLTGLARPGPGRRLSLQDTLALDRVRRLHVVRCDGRDVLLITGGAADIVVGWLPGAGVSVGGGTGP